MPPVPDDGGREAPGSVPSRVALVLWHQVWEGPALIGEALREAGFEIDSRSVIGQGRGGSGEASLPDVHAYQAIVVMGGPMNADQVDEYPALEAERDLLREAVAAGIPTVGVCLGAQLLARALGAEVRQGVAAEFGFLPVTVESDDPLMTALGGGDVLHWHCDVAELPQGATLLASTEQTPNQAYRFGSAYGFQFHPELDRATLADWLSQDVMARELEESGSSVDQVRRLGTEILPELEPRVREAFRRFFAGE